MCFLKVKPEKTYGSSLCIENNVTLSSDVVVNNLIMFAYTQNYVECGLFSNLFFFFVCAKLTLNYQKMMHFKSIVGSCYCCDKVLCMVFVVVKYFYVLPVSLYYSPALKRKWSELKLTSSELMEL